MCDYCSAYCLFDPWPNPSLSPSLSLSLHLLSFCSTHAHTHTSLSLSASAQFLFSTCTHITLSLRLSAQFLFSMRTHTHTHTPLSLCHESGCHSLHLLHHTTAAHHLWTASPIMHCAHTFPSTITPITQLSPFTH